MRPVETSWLATDREHHTLYATGMIDLGRRVTIDVMPGNRASDLGSWLGDQGPAWCAGIEVVAMDLAESYRTRLTGRLEQAVRVADPFHVVRIANRVVDQVRRRVQNAALGHRGRARGPLYRLLLGIRTGDPDDEVMGAWLAMGSTGIEPVTPRV